MGMSLEDNAVHVGHVILGLPMGGTEGLVDQMLRRPPAGFRASAICLDEVGVLGESAIRDGHQVQLIPRGAGLNWSLPAAIARHARERSIDILHCHQYTPWFYGALTRLFCRRLKVIFTEHGRLYPDIVPAKRKLFNRLIIPLTQCTTAVSPAVAQALNRAEGFPPDKIRIIFNGVESSRFACLPGRSELRSRLGLHEGGIYFILCSRFDPIKWIEGLLQAFEKVAARNDQVRLLLVGDGQERENIKRKIGDLGLQDKVLTPGYSKDVPQWLAASDVFVLSSLSEGTSVSLIESMAAGLPSVVTRVGGNEYVVEDGQTGFIVPPRRADSLADAMLRLADDPDLRAQMGGRARSRFREHFELERMFASYEKIYRELLAA